VHVEVNEFPEISELHVTVLGNSDSGCSVKADDSVVRLGWESGEKLEYIFPILFEFGLMMREDKCCCLDGWIPCCNPLSMCSNRLHWCRRANGDFELADFLLVALLLGYGE